MLRVIIAEDHHLVRQGIRALLEKSGDVEIVGEAANGFEVVSLAQQLEPDFVIMDLSMPQLDGIQATEQIVKLGMATQIIILSMYSKLSIVQEVLRKGAKGYLLKSALSEELHLALQAAQRNETYLSPAISTTLLENLWGLQQETGELSVTQSLTPRERQVLQLIAEGYTNNDIADKLVVSAKTVEKHRANLMEKLGVKDIPNLMRVAIKHDLIFVD